MPIEIVPGDKAWATYRANALARWPTRKAPDRLHPLAQPESPRPFALKGDERVFCIGSCFARAIENALKALGFDVLSIMEDLPRSPNRDRSDRGMFNKYNVATILNELRWAFGEGAPYRHEDVLVAPPGDLLLQDLQLAGPGYREEPGQARRFREGFNAAFRRVAKADVVVLTLGLSEVWLDKASGLYLNAAPMEHLVAAYPGRYELHVLDLAQTSAMLEEIDRLLAKNLRPGFRLLLTVSPVPLWSTFRDQDVLVANAYSKAVLRTAVDAFVAGRPHASYFPSFEAALLSNPLAVWAREDFRHVDPRFVDFLMQAALTQYGGARDDTAAMQARTRARLVRRVGLGTAGVAVRDWWRQWRQKLALSKKKGPRRQVEVPDVVRGHLDRWDGNELVGWAYLEGQDGPVTVTVRLDGRDIATAIADIERDDVASELGEPHRHSGFHIPLDIDSLHGEEIGVSVGGRTLMTLPLNLPPDEK